MELSRLKNKNFQEVTFRARKLKITHSEKMSYILEVELSSPKLKKLLILFILNFNVSR